MRWQSPSEACSTELPRGSLHNDNLDEITENQREIEMRMSKLASDDDGPRSDSSRPWRLVPGETFRVRETIMRRLLFGCPLGIACLSVLFAVRASAHPSSGIVVDQKGQVFF